MLKTCDVLDTLQFVLFFKKKKDFLLALTLISWDKHLDVIDNSFSLLLDQ